MNKDGTCQSRPFKRYKPLGDNDVWGTPPSFLADLKKRFSLTDFDPCPLDWSPDTHPDGLQIDWEDGTFVNPPFSKTGKFMKKASEEHAKGKLVVVLTNAITDTVWFHDLCYNREAEGVSIEFIKGRLNFLKPGQNPESPNVKKNRGPRGQMITIFRPLD